MKHRIFSMILVLIICLSLPLCVSAEGSSLVYDEADLLTPQEESELESQLSQIGQDYEVQVVLVTVPDLGGADIEDAANSLYDDNGMGYGENHDGVLLLVSMSRPRKYYILTNGLGYKAIGNDEIDEICDEIQDAMADGNYAEAFRKFADECEYYLDGHINGFPFHVGSNLLFALVIGLVVGLITVLVMKGQLKSVRKQTRANLYVTDGSLHLTNQSDIYLYRTVTRTKKPSNNTGSRSGSSRGGGGRSF